jgi:hypothetical protein
MHSEAMKLLACGQAEKSGKGLTPLITKPTLGHDQEWISSLIILTAYSSFVHLNVILSSAPNYSKWPLSKRFSPSVKGKALEAPVQINTINICFNISMLLRECPGLKFGPSVVIFCLATPSRHPVKFLKWTLNRKLTGRFVYTSKMLLPNRLIDSEKFSKNFVATHLSIFGFQPTRYFFFWKKATTAGPSGLYLFVLEKSMK